MHKTKILQITWQHDLQAEKILVRYSDPFCLKIIFTIYSDNIMTSCEELLYRKCQMEITGFYTQISFLKSGLTQCEINSG